MKRQLYEGGGIMSLSKEGIGGGIIKGVDMGSRTGFFNPVKSLKKFGKKAVGAVKDIASSDLGKAALLYAGTAGLGSIGSGLTGMARFAPSNFMGNVGRIGSFLTGGFPGKNIVDEVALTGKQNIFQKALSKVTGGGITGNVGKFAALGAVSTFLTSTLGMSEEQAEEEVARDPSKYLSLYYKNLNPQASEEEVQKFVSANTSEYAEGGRIGFENGGTYEDFEKFMMRRSESLSERHKEELRKQFEMYMRSKDPTVEAAEGGRIGFAEGPILPNDSTQPVNPFGPKPGDFGIEEDIPIKMASNEISIDKIEMLIKRGADNDLIKEFTGASDGVIDQIRDAMERKNKAGGGIMNRAGYALGDTASQNAMQAAGIEGLPIRQNPKGVKELDLRDNGGFIPPVGIKEKEDDIPAMLSNNEFVFTADAVRGMGEGDVELGAQRMYDQMKMLEAGGKV